MTAHRSGNPRHRRQGSPDWEKAGGLLLGIIAVAAVALLVFFRAIADPVPRDPRTMCPETGPSNVTVIVLDTTDRVGATSRDDILGRLGDLVTKSQADEMMLVYDTSWSPQTTTKPGIKVCNPGDPDTTNPLFSNPELVRRRLDERFKAPLAKLFEELLFADEAPVSPLMETIQAISVTVLARHEFATVPKRLILVSDLLQHTDHLSLYSHSLDFDDFEESLGYKALQTSLEEVVVTILFVQRHAHSRLGNDSHLIEFWDRWISDQGGQLRSVSKIDGLN